MRLVLEKTGEELVIGGIYTTRDGTEYRLKGIQRPHKPSSTGRVYVEPVGVALAPPVEASYFPGVIGAKWIEREDHGYEGDSDK